jgi:hypothetical protein
VSTISAIDYAGLVGRDVAMERPATEEERQAGYPDTVGMSGLVVGVTDEIGPTGRRVVVLVDYGMGFAITAEDRHMWRFEIRAGEAA